MARFILFVNHSMNRGTQGGAMDEMISRGDAELLFRKLADENVFVFCVGILWGWRLMLSGKLVMEESEITLRAEAGGFTLRLDAEDMVFTYSEPGKMSLPGGLEAIPEEMRDSACIAVALPFRVPPAALAAEYPLAAPFREILFFLELQGELPTRK
jgi:hypothetical protein